MFSRLGGYCFFLAGIAAFSFNSFDRQPSAEAGVLDARSWKFSESRLALTGQWIFFQSELYEPEQCRGRKGTYGEYPALWNNKERDGIGFGTYYVKVLVPDSILTFALEIPQIYSSSNVWVNDKLIATMGKVGRTKERTVPQWIFKTASFSNARDTLHIVVQIANFHHYKGGSTSAIMLGTPNCIVNDKFWTFGSNLAEIVLLFIAGCAFLFFYFRKSDKEVIFYFSLLCLTWCVRIAFSNQYPITALFPGFNWAALVKIEYLTLYGAMIWASLFFNALLKDLSSQIFTYLLVGINIFFTVFTLVTSPVIFSHWIMVYLTIALITMLYITINILRALFRNQTGAWFLFSSLFLGILVFGYDIFAYQSSHYNFVLLNTGYIVIFGLTAAALLFHLGIFKEKWNTNSEVLTFNEMIRDSRTGE